MRKAKIINIEGVGEVTVKEVSPFAVYKAMSAQNKVDELMTLAVECVDLPKEKLQKLYLSEIEQLVDAFVEVNGSFLAIAGKLGLEATMTAIIKAILAELSTILPEMFAGSYKLVMAKLPGIMAGAVS
ncbi:MAG: hypothetical protein ACD_75C01687G0002 [uncultured bacterium]|nr:MAG: hypothetical protein ACD_75C01687G0002 [uncultured bacterium]